VQGNTPARRGTRRKFAVALAVARKYVRTIRPADILLERTVRKVLLGAICLAQMTTADRAAVDQYRSALAAVERRADGSAIETILAKADDVREVLQRPKADGGSLLESLPADAFARLTRELRGLIVNREEVLIVRPDADFFVGLATAYGSDADRRFFSAYKATYPDSVWPTYVEQQTDYSGCTAFGEGKLVEAYRLWSEFRRTTPASYAAAAAAELDRVSHELTASTCACGDRSTVDRELDEFLRAFPASPASAAVAARLQDLREGRSKMRAPCVSG